MSATAAAGRPRVSKWIGALAPLVLIAALVVGFLVLNPIASLREVPPVEAVAFESVVFRPDNIEIGIRNDGPDPVTLAQMLVNDSYWSFEASDRTLSRLETATINIDYPWEEGLPVNLVIVTSTGATIDHEIEVAALTPESDAATLWTYALLGIYIGIVPITIGLLWFPALRRASRPWVTFFLAFTVGLLTFLLLDTTAEGLELAGETPAVLDGLGLFAIGAIGAVVALLWLAQALGRRSAIHEERAPATGLTLAYLVAAGIGLHNLGEGLAVGAALAAGEAALGTFLVLGFALHNTTEGLAIVSPLGGKAERPALVHFAALGAVAGLPAVAGAWLGGFAFSAAWAALAFGVAAGAIAQVVWQIGAGMSRGKSLATGFGACGFLTGIVVMYATGLLTV